MRSIPSPLLWICTSEEHRPRDLLSRICHLRRPQMRWLLGTVAPVSPPQSAKSMYVLGWEGNISYDHTGCQWNGPSECCHWRWGGGLRSIYFLSTGAIHSSISHCCIFTSPGEGNGGVMLPDLHIGRDAPLAAAMGMFWISIDSFGQIQLYFLFLIARLWDNLRTSSPSPCW